MKKIATLLLAAAIFWVTTHAQQPKPFTITGDVSKVPPGLKQVHLFYKKGGDYIADSCKIVKGKYRLKGVISASTSVRIIFSKAGRPKMEEMIKFRKTNVAEIFIEPGNINIVSGKIPNDVVVTGSKSHQAFIVYKQETKAADDMLDDYNTKFDEAIVKNDSVEMTKMDNSYQEVFNNITAIRLNYIEKNISSPVALYVLDRALGSNQESRVEALFSKISPSIQSSEDGVEMAINLKTLRGKPAPDFISKDTADAAVSLSSFKGKYVLLDFWASWCAPCRAENPNVVNAYQKFKNKNFIVVSVSLDDVQDKSKWIAAIYKDGLNIPGWIHLSDLKSMNSPLAKLYGIKGIPANFLLDTQGNIIDKDLRGDMLDKKLEEVLR